MLGITAERFPRGGALTISLMGGAGMASVALAVPLMGAHIDRYGPGAALQMMAAPGAILVVVFLGFMFWGGDQPAPAHAEQFPQRLPD
jgi:hypothetical protein